MAKTYGFLTKEIKKKSIERAKLEADYQAWIAKGNKPQQIPSHYIRPMTCPARAAYSRN
jgi:hypothetical protein